MDTNKVDIENILTYVRASTIPAQVGRKCVDGRYLPDQAPGMIARPGGDCGYVMALMAVSKKKKLGLTPEQCFNAVYNAVAVKSGFCMHTDHHTDPDRYTHIGLIGCGHLAKAANKKLCKQYHVDSDDVKRVVDYARNICEISRTIHMVNLDGNHQEKGVLIVSSDTYSVLADNPKLQQMYFIYDEERDREFIRDLVKEMQIVGVTYADMKEESDLQLQATLQNLAQGLPIFRITFIREEPQIKYIGVVEKTLPSLKNRLPKFAHTLLPRLQRFIHIS